MKPEGFTLILQDTRSIRDSMNISKIELFAYNYILLYYKHLKYKKNIFNLGIKTVLYSKYNRINGLVGV